MIIIMPLRAYEDYHQRYFTLAGPWLLLALDKCYINYNNFI